MTDGWSSHAAEGAAGRATLVPVHRALFPHPALAPFVEGYAVSRDAPNAASRAFRVVPDGCTDLLVEVPLSGDAVRAQVFGPKTRAIVVCDPEPTEKIAIRFRPGAAARFLGAPAAQLTDRRIELSALWPEAAQRVRLETHGERASAQLPRLERALLARRASLCVSPARALVDAAVAALARSDGSTRVDRLCAELGTGVRRLERLFADEVGLAPKRLARILRFRGAFRALARGEPQAHTAARLGYADQAHLLRDFRALAGAPPSAVFSTSVSDSSNPGAAAAL
jgi:AraC-like DNA-binding protein